MNDREYPSGVDLVWIASDRRGEIAAFVTGGEGPIPDKAFFQLELDPSPEELFAAVPESSGFEVLLGYQVASSFGALAARGVYVYDWTDVHKTAARASRSYELVARPVLPSHVGQLPQELGVIAGRVILPVDAFLSNLAVHVDGIAPRPPQ
jgi:hypothetical protein